MAVTLGTPTTAALANGGTTTTFSFVSDGNPLYVRVSGWLGGTGTISGVTFNGTALTKVADSTLSSGGDLAYIWRLTSPGALTANVVVTATGNGNSQAGIAAAANASGQDGTTPEGTAATSKSAATGTSTGNLTISGAATGDLTIVCVAVGTGTAVTPSKTGGGTQTEEWDTASNGEQSEGNKVPDAVTAVSASWTGSTTWAMAALPLKTTAAAGGGLPFFMQEENLMVGGLGRKSGGFQ